MINPDEYRSNGKSRPLMFNVRLRKLKGPKPTRDEVVDVLETILATRRVPANWRLGWIDWRDPRRASATWTRGSLATFDEDGLGKVLEAALDSARVAIVRKDHTREDAE